MTIPNLNAVEPICSWRLNDPQLELKVSRDRENIWYSVCHHFDKSYWPNSASSPADLMPVFAHCVWKGVKKRIESRLFSDGQGAVCVSVNSRTKKIGIEEWEDGALEDFLTKKNPIISAINDDSSLAFQEELRDGDRSRAYDVEAEAGITRWCRTEKGELVIVEEEPVTETTMSVASGNESTEGQDIRHIKRVEGKKEKDIFRLFNWETKKTLEVPHKTPKSSDGGVLPEEIGDCTFEIINTNNGKQLALHKTHPLDCFMLGSDLFTAEPSQVEEWVYEQFYRGPDDQRTPFEYTNFIRARKESFSFFGKGVRGKRAEGGANRSFEVETWCVEMKISASCIWQFPIGLYSFLTGMFCAQNSSEVDQNNMRELVQGASMRLDDRKRALDDFAAELKACSVIKFYMACDRSSSRLEVNGRVWVRGFARAGQGIREVSISIVEGAGGGLMYAIEGAGGGITYFGKTAGGGFMYLGEAAGKGLEGTGKGLVRVKNWVTSTLGGIDMEDVNQRMKKVNCGLKTACEIAKTAHKLQVAWEATNGAPSPQGSSAQNHPKMDKI